MHAIGRQPQRARDGALSTTNATAASRRRCVAWCNSTTQPSFAQAAVEACADLPQFAKDEFVAFLECSILAHGFLRLRGGDCSHEKLVAFSCKRRGPCPSCGVRRMAQTAAHLVDHVNPHVPVRQCVLTLPIPLRLLLAAQPEPE